MKKRVLFYLIAFASTISLQSCVTNYVVSEPMKYKSDAKLQKVETQNLTVARASVYAGGETTAKATFASINKAEKDMAIAEAIKYERTIDQILNQASTYLGTPYRYGGTTRSGIDCSAFVLSVFRETTDIELPRVAAAQAQEGESVDKSELAKGDLVFFSQGKGRISHVGIVQDVDENGDVKFIHAATSRGVMVSSLNDRYWGPKYRFAKRILNTRETNIPL